MPLYEMILILRAQCRQSTKLVLLDLCKTLYKLDCHLTDIKMLSGTALPYQMVTTTREKVTHGLYFVFKLYGTPQFKKDVVESMRYNPDVVREAVFRCNLDGNTDL